MKRIALPDHEKRQPTLADRFLATRFTQHGSLIDLSHTELTKRRLRSAHRFILDDEAAIRIATVARDLPELIIREHQFARAPFDLTWIEFPHEPIWRTVTGREPEEDCDQTVGYL